MVSCPNCNALGHLNIGSMLVGRDGVSRKVAAGPFYSKSPAEEQAERYETRYNTKVNVVKVKDENGEPLYYICEEAEK